MFRSVPDLVPRPPGGSKRSLFRRSPGTRSTEWKLAKIGQTAEHEFAGVRSGIMDQFASVFGQADHALFLDCRSLEWSAIPVAMQVRHLQHQNKARSCGKRIQQAAGGMRRGRAIFSATLAARRDARGIRSEGGRYARSARKTRPPRYHREREGCSIRSRHYEAAICAFRRADECIA